VADEILRHFETENIGNASVRPRPTTLHNIYVGLGRFSDARRVAQQLGPDDPRNMWMYATVRMEAFLGNPNAMEPLREMMNFVYQKPERFPVSAMTVSDLIRLGMLRRARQVVTLANQGQSAPTFFHLREIEGHLAIAEGRLEEGARVFESVHGTESNPSEVLRMAWTLADAWKVRGDLQAATKVLEDALRDRRLWAACVTDYYGGVASWIHAHDELADLYLATGRDQESKAIDAGLLKLLAVADADHPVLAHIRARQAKL
jgi:hypothetical protein